MKTGALLALSIVSSLALAGGVSAASTGWKPMLSDDKKCTVQVPGNWGPAVTGVGMQVPGGRSHVLLSLEEGSMTDYKGFLQFRYGKVKAIQDTSARYWIEAPAPKSNNMREWSVGVPASGGVCSALIAFDNTLSEADAKTIALSLKKH